MITRSRRNIGNKKGNETENKNENKTEEEPKGNLEKVTTRNNKRTTLKTDNVKTISESYNGDVNDVESWVKKTKDVINQKLAPKALYSDEENETQEKQETKIASKRGRKKKEITINKLKVEHTSEDVKEEMILTLKDKNVLDETEEADCLINQELETLNNKSALHKDDHNYWNKNYYDPLSSYNENNPQTNGEHFQMPLKYEQEKNFFEVEINHEKDEEEEEKKKKQEQTKTAKKKPVGRKDEQNNTVHETEEEAKEEKEKEKADQLPNESPKKKRGRKKKQVENETQQEILQETNESTKTDVFVQLKKRKIQNISKRKKEDRWGFLFGNDKEEKQKEQSRDKVKEGEHSKKKHKEKKHEGEKELEKIKKKTMKL